MGKNAIIVLLLLLTGFAPVFAGEQQTIHLATINWEPFTGERLPHHGFFSELVTAAFKRVGYRVEYQYRPWSRALAEAKRGVVHGLMVAYWKKDRTQYLDYPNIVMKVREEFITLRDNFVSYDGTLASLKGYRIGVLNESVQARDLEEAGLTTDAVNDQSLNVKKILKKRIDAVLVPRSIFFYHMNRLAPQFGREQIRILKPPYKIYDMYVAFSKKKPDYMKLTSDFNRGLDMIKSDGTYDRILLGQPGHYKE